MFRVPSSLLPEVRDTAGRFGDTAKEHLGASLPILAMAGDQQSALVGQACFEPGMVKATDGTGAFVLLNTGAKLIRSTNRMLTTIAYQWGGQRTTRSRARSSPPARRLVAARRTRRRRHVGGDGGARGGLRPHPPDLHRSRLRRARRAPLG